jgi:hypothetical protein
VTRFLMQWGLSLQGKSLRRYQVPLAIRHLPFALHYIKRMCKLSKILKIFLKGCKDFKRILMSHKNSKCIILNFRHLLQSKSPVYEYVYKHMGTIGLSELLGMKPWKLLLKVRSVFSIFVQGPRLANSFNRRKDYHPTHLCQSPLKKHKATATGLTNVIFSN